MDLFALAATRALATWSGIETGLSPDRYVLFFTLLISGLAALALGLVPLLSAMHSPVAGVLRATSGNATASHSRALGGRVMVAGQVAVCLVLLMAASLLLRTLSNYATQNLGMQAEELLVFGVTPQGQTDTHALYRNLLDHLHRLPGVESVSMVAMRPGAGSSNNDGQMIIDGVPSRVRCCEPTTAVQGSSTPWAFPCLLGATSRKPTPSTRST